MTKYAKDIREIREDVKKILLLVGEIKIHRLLIILIITALIGMGVAQVGIGG